MNRLSRLQDLMQDHEFSSMLLTLPSNIFYFAGFMGPGYLVVPLEGGPKLYVHPLDYEAARLYASGEVEVEKVKLTSTLADVVRDLPSGLKVRMGFDRLEAEQYLRLRELVEAGELRPGGELVWKLRMVKDPSELEKMKKAAEISSQCMDLASQMIADGVRESEVKAEVMEEMLKLGADKPAFDPIVSSGPRSALPHGGAGDRLIREGDVVVVDLGAVFEGYCSDITRTFYVGPNPPEEVQKVYELVMDTKNLVEEAAKSWVLASSLDEAARGRINVQGYGDYFVHNLGHGVGIDVHEAPKLSPTSQEILQENTTVTFEPGIYIPGKFGVRIEDTVLVYRDGVRKLTSAPYIFALG